LVKNAFTAWLLQGSLMHPDLERWLKENGSDTYSFTVQLERLTFNQLRRFVFILYKESVAEIEDVVGEGIETIRQEIEGHGNPVRDNVSYTLTKVFYANVQVGMRRRRRGVCSFAVLPCSFAVLSCSFAVIICIFFLAVHSCLCLYGTLAVDFIPSFEHSLFPWSLLDDPCYRPKGAWSRGNAPASGPA
jgi:hypothetical protein